MGLLLVVSFLVLAREAMSDPYDGLVTTPHEGPDATAAPLHVVAAVIVDDGRILACRRSPNRSAGGQWEFPGGKVEAGESASEALIREIREELGVGIEVLGELNEADTLVGDRVIRLTCFRTRLTDARPIESTDHDSFLWLTAPELETLEWALPDIPAVRLLAAGGAG